MALDQPLGQAEPAAQFARLVLEQLAQWLDQAPEVHALGQAADIVMRVDRDRGTAVRTHLLDHIKIEPSPRGGARVARTTWTLLGRVPIYGTPVDALIGAVGHSLKGSDQDAKDRNRYCQKFR